MARAQTLAAGLPEQGRSNLQHQRAVVGYFGRPHHAEGADRDQRDGASCWNATRVESARLLDRWARTLQRGDARVLIVGDLNAYAQEAPVRTLVDAGWRDAFEAAGVESPYSYVYDGQLGRLDHALLSPGLASRLRGAAEWHSNADEPE